jgi:hypothetical protein
VAEADTVAAEAVVAPTVAEVGAPAVVGAAAVVAVVVTTSVLSHEFIEEMSRMNAGSSTAFAANSAANSAQDDIRFWVARDDNFIVMRTSDSS